MSNKIQKQVQEHLISGSKIIKQWLLFCAICFAVISCSKADLGDDTTPPPQGNTSATINNFTPDSGSVGTIVTITGTNFSASPSEDLVTFNGVQAVIQTATTTQLTVSVPQGASTGKIVLKISPITATSASDFKVSQPSWIRKTDFPGGTRGFAAGFAIGSKAYILTGYTPYVGPVAKDLWEYDESANTWKQKTDFPAEPRVMATSFSIGGIGYLGMGFIYGNSDTTTEHKDLWAYDPAGDAWTRKADIPSLSRENSIAFTIGNKAYVGLGTHYRAGYAELKDFWEYDPTIDTWTRKADYPGTASIESVAFALNGKGYVGLGADDSQIFSKEFWQYDPTSNAWARKNDFTGPTRQGAVAVSINGIGYRGFGDEPGKTLVDFWRYDAISDNWMLQTQFPAGARAFPVLVSIGNKGYMGTGYDSTSKGVQDFWQFNP
jgi:N-acetylneuraminic acid mutarotase